MTYSRAGQGTCGGHATRGVSDGVKIAFNLRCIMWDMLYALGYEVSFQGNTL